MRKLLEQMIAEHSNRTPEQVEVDIERDKILTAQEAVEYGMVDRVLTMPEGELDYWDDGLLDLVAMA
jgi:ATP-dependent Clp protease protease subunit